MIVIIIIIIFFFSFKGSKLRARVIQLEEDLSSTRQQHRDGTQEVNLGFISFFPSLKNDLSSDIVMPHSNWLKNFIIMLGNFIVMLRKILIHAIFRFVSSFAVRRDWVL